MPEEAELQSTSRANMFLVRKSLNQTSAQPRRKSAKRLSIEPA